MSDVFEIVPVNLLDAIAQLEVMFSGEDIEFFKNKSEAEACFVMQQAIGRVVRNKWKLWEEGTPLRLSFEELGLHHADDMSGIIFTTLYRYLNDLPLDIEVQVEYYKKYWDGVKKKNE